MNTNRLAIAVVGLLCLAAGAYLGTRGESRAKASTAEILFARTLPDAGGAPHALSQWRGKTLLVNFWATWCAPCVEEMPELAALQAEVAARDIQIVGIGIDSAANIAEFAKKYRISYPLYVAGADGTSLLRALGNSSGGLPFTVLVAADGTVRQTYLGRLKIAEVRHDLDQSSPKAAGN